jgi:class 3 adenylate cyclase
MFTDIVDSTALLVDLGDEAWLTLLRWHNALVRSAFLAHAGREVNATGDGFFAVFERSASALRCAFDIQEMLATERRRHGFGVHVRIGIQWVDVLETRDNYVGRGVHEAARINELAQADEILVSVDALAAAGDRFPRMGARAVRLRGFPEPLELVSLYVSPGVNAPSAPTPRIVSASVTASP